MHLALDPILHLREKSITPHTQSHRAPGFPEAVFGNHTHTHSAMDRKPPQQPPPPHTQPPHPPRALRERMIWSSRKDGLCPSRELPALKSRPAHSRPRGEGPAAGEGPALASLNDRQRTGLTLRTLQVMLFLIVTKRDALFVSPSIFPGD